MITKLPTYEELLIELYGTIQALVLYSESNDVKEEAAKRLAEIGKIDKQAGGFFVRNEFTPPPVKNLEWPSEEE